MQPIELEAAVRLQLGDVAEVVDWPGRMPSTAAR